MFALTLIIYCIVLIIFQLYFNCMIFSAGLLVAM